MRLPAKRLMRSLRSFRDALCVLCQLGMGPQGGGLGPGQPTPDGLGYSALTRCYDSALQLTLGGRAMCSVPDLFETSDICSDSA